MTTIIEEFEQIKKDTAELAKMVGVRAEIGDKEDDNYCETCDGMIGDGHDCDNCSFCGTDGSESDRQQEE